MGRDVVAVMEALGHVRFAVAGHDRGARVGYRLALDQPGRIERLALLDILPSFDVWRRIKSGPSPRHWGFLSRPPRARDEIVRDPNPLFHGLDGASGPATARSTPSTRARLPPTGHCCNDPSRIHARCEDYRAGATRDVAETSAILPPASRSPARP